MHFHFIVFLSEAASSDSGVIEKYLSGYTECTNEVFRYMNLMEGIDDSSKQRLMSHLSSGMQTVASTKTAPNLKTPPPTRVDGESELERLKESIERSNSRMTPPYPVVHRQSPPQYQRKVSSPKSIPQPQLFNENLQRLSLLTQQHPAVDTSLPIGTTINISPLDFESVDSGLGDRSTPLLSSSYDDDGAERSSPLSMMSSSSGSDITDAGYHGNLMLPDEDDSMWRPW